MLTKRGTECYGKVENHAYQLYLAVEDIDDRKISLLIDTSMKPVCHYVTQ